MVSKYLALLHFPYFTFQTLKFMISLGFPVYLLSKFYFTSCFLMSTVFNEFNGFPISL